MIRWLCCGAAALTLASFGVATAAQTSAPCQMQVIAELPFQFDHDRLLVDAEINGRPAKMIVDTGAFATLIFRSSAIAMGMQIQPVNGVQYFGVGGESGAGETRLAQLRVANFMVANRVVQVSGRQPLGAEQGLLGSDVLLRADVDFDVAEGKIRWFKPKGCTGEQVVYWWGKPFSAARIVDSGELRHIHVMTQVNGVPVLTEMDTGSPVTFLTPRVAARAGVTPASDGVKKTEVTHGLGAQPVQTYLGLFQTFSFGDETIRNARLRIADMFAADTEVNIGTRIPTGVGMPDMLLGADFFRSHRVYVSPRQKMVYISYVGGPVFQAGAAPAPTP